MNKILKAVLKHVVALAICGVVATGLVIAGVAIYHVSHTQQAKAEAAQSITQADGTTHDMTIVWQNGTEQQVTYSETVTPAHSEYRGPTNDHICKTSFFTMNPIDSAAKALERINPSTFAEGDRPAVVVSDKAMTVSKSEGATAKGEGGSNPVMGEYLGWVGIIILGVIGLLVFGGIGKWLYNNVWKPVEPAVAAVAQSAIAKVIPSVPAAQQ